MLFRFRWVKPNNRKACYKLLGHYKSANRKEKPQKSQIGRCHFGLRSAPNFVQEELEKVRSVLQRLQAENISLKAQLGQFSDEEKQVRDETARTVHEIGNLSQELTSLRSQVVNAKSSLIEASAELKAQLEKRE